MKRILIIITAITSSIAFSQQESQFNMFWQNASLYNPAQTGVEYQHYANVSNQITWFKQGDSPNNFTAQYETKIDKIKSGIGVGYVNDRFWISTSNKVYLNYAYHLKFKNAGNLSLGIAGVYNHLKFKGGWVPPTSIPDGNLPGETRGGVLNINAGLFYKIKSLEMGVSSTQINEPLNKNVGFKNVRHYFSYLGYEFHLSPKFDLKPRLYFKSVSNFYALDINAQLTYDKKYWLGLTYRSGDSFGAQIGVDLKKKFRIGYAYGISTSKLTNAMIGANEISLSLMLN